MNKIKTVKIKNEDGSVDQEAFHISADARNIDMTNGYNVQETIGTIDIENDKNVAEQLNNIKKKPYYFNTVADMKEANYLKEGDTAITLGYYSIGDGGRAEYKIVSGNYTNNDKTIIKLFLNNVFALFITPKQLNTIMFGDTNQSSSNDSDFLQFVFDYCSQYNIPGLLYKNKVYNIGTSIKINSNTYIDFNDSTFYMPNNTNKHFLYNMDNYSTQTNEIHDITLINGKVDGNNINNYSGNLTGMFVILYYCKNFTIENFEITRCQRNNLQFYECSYISIKNIKFSHVCDVNTVSTSASSAITIYNRDNKIAGKHCLIENIDVDEYGFGILFFINYDNIIMNNMNFTNGVVSPALSIPVTITNCHFIECNNLYIDKTSTVAIEINTNSRYITFNNLKITNSFQPLTLGPNTDSTSQNEYIYFNNCYFDTTNNYFLSYSNAKDVYFNNCTIQNGGIASSYDLIGNLFFTNCIFKNSDFSHYYVSHVANYLNCIIDDQFYINKMSPIPSNGESGRWHPLKLDCKIPFQITRDNSLDINLTILQPLSRKMFLGTLEIVSFWPQGSSQNYRGIYDYSISINNDDLGSLSTLIREIGASYRKVTPAIGSNKGHIILTTSSDQPVNGYINLYN